MLNLLSTLLFLAPLTGAYALSPRAPVPGACMKTHLPSEQQYTLGYQTFCETFIGPDEKKTITEGNPLVATVTLTAHDDNKPLRWVYKVSVYDNTPLAPRYEITRDMCLEKFKSAVESDAAGGLGKAYCVVDGEGVTLAQGGVVKEKKGGQGGFGSVYWESRGRLDD
ncbi:uncharacterized protein K460DRAFT_350303 [Cucurbitaria berberidis CBS 394.84]|uniref:Uncharacterized protein n=1 Tax=Cucurbitaria berberidis CBS 394.84 TaxID=1168544 RepID=A0A9P4LCZ9_9PLEO|nr:uncharacterized protein K460DRAFT_350303 [Cucurbitaria berberidis CBS 394.84]KAF1850223.1 hypothetical protein K460DRAFT_350303 [Cucurbitaria berberidis CBS 394.84]